MRITEILTGGAKPSRALAPKGCCAADNCRCQGRRHQARRKEGRGKAPKAAPKAAEGVKDDVTLIGRRWSRA